LRNKKIQVPKRLLLYRDGDEYSVTNSDLKDNKMGKKNTITETTSTSYMLRCTSFNIKEKTVWLRIISQGTLQFLQEFILCQFTLEEAKEKENKKTL
jgi:hypothetical protein